MIAESIYGQSSGPSPFSRLLVFLSASELARYLVAIGTDMGRLTGADVATVVFVPPFFLSNAFMPVKFLPKWLQVVVRINPITYSVDATRAIMLDGWIWSEILLPIGVIVALDVVFGVAAVVILARATNVSTR